MSNPHEPGRISVTLKQDGKDGTWLVFHGSAAEVRGQITDTFVMEDDGSAPLYDLINEATRLYKASGNVTSALGGRVIKGGDSNDAKQSGTGSAWDRAAGNGAETPTEPEVDPNVVRLTAEIEAVTEVPALKELYARNKAVFDANPDLIAAYKAKGKSLS